MLHEHARPLVSSGIQKQSNLKLFPFIKHFKATEYFQDLTLILDWRNKGIVGRILW